MLPPSSSSTCIPQGTTDALCCYFFYALTTGEKILSMPMASNSPFAEDFQIQTLFQPVPQPIFIYLQLLVDTSL